MPNITEVFSNIWRITEGNVYFYLINGRNRALFIDSGFGRVDLQQLAGSLGMTDPLLALTHGDRDHTGGTGQFPAFYLHPAEYAHLELKCPGAHPTAIWSGDMIDLGNRKLEVCLLPGHTPGSTVYLDQKHRLAFVGDIVQKDFPIYLFGPGRNIPAYIEGLKRLYNMADHLDILLSCHGRPLLTPADIPDIIRACQRYLSGELTAHPAPEGIPAKLYIDGDVQFYA